MTDGSVPRSASPPSIQFHLHFIADVNEALLRATTETLERSRPHLNTSLDGRTVYEILPVGRLLLILENRTATFSEATMEQTAMATPELMISATQTFLLSTWPTPGKV